MDKYPFNELSVADVRIMESNHSDFDVKQVKEAMSKLAEISSETPTTSSTFLSMIAQCHFFSNEWEKGIEILRKSFDLLLKNADKEDSLACFTAGYYQTVVNLCPLEILKNLPLPNKSLSIKETERILLKKAEEEGLTAELCLSIAPLFLADGDFEQAALWIDKAEENDEKGIFALSVALAVRKFNMARIARLTDDFENEQNLVKKYLDGLQLAYYKTGQGKAWREFEAVYQGAAEENIAVIKSLYPDAPDSLSELLKAVDGTYYREYAGEKVTFYLLGSDVEE